MSAPLLLNGSYGERRRIARGQKHQFGTFRCRPKSGPKDVWNTGRIANVQRALHPRRLPTRGSIREHVVAFPAMYAVEPKERRGGGEGAD
jgi:hypothetical protein